MRSCWFILGPIFWKLWPYLLFLTPHNFANGPHFVALAQLQVTKTESNNCCAHLSYTFSESWACKDSVGICPERVSGWCTHNFDATDLPNSQFGPLYPKLYRGTPIVDLGPIVWHTAPPKVRKPRNRVRQKRLFFGVFLGKKSFPSKTLTVSYSMSYIFWKLLFQRLILATYQWCLFEHPTRRQNFVNILQPHWT